MSLNQESFFEFLKNHENKLGVLFVLLFSAVITIALIWINSSQGILGHAYRDVYFYLIEALRFSGYSIGGYPYINYLSPLVPFLTSILFKLGFVSETSLFTVTGIFYILGVIGVYSLLKLRFKTLIAILGAVVYTGLSVNLMWVANGTIDIPSVALTILSIYFFILGIEKNQKYLYLAFPLAVLGFFAKYTAGLAIPLMILYILSKPNIYLNIKKYLKNGIGAIIVGGITLLPFATYFYINKIPLGFVNQAETIASKTTTVPDVNNHLFYYLTNIQKFIYNPNHTLSYFIIIITVVGILIGIYLSLNLLKNQFNSINNKKIELLNLLNKIKIKVSKQLYVVLLVINVLIIAATFLTAGKISFIYSELIFFAFAFTFSYLINKIIFTDENKEKNSFSFDFLMFGWFFSYLIFFSAHLVKADRYFTTMAPGFVFFTTLALNFILNSLDKIKIKNYLQFKLHLKEIQIKSIKTIIPIAIIILFMISSVGYLTIDKQDPVVHDEKKIANWIKLNDSNYKTEVIWAERGPVFTWYLQKEVVYVNWLTNPKQLSNSMIENNVTYFISIHKQTNISGYSPVKKVGEVIVYKKNN